MEKGSVAEEIARRYVQIDRIRDGPTVQPQPCHLVEQTQRQAFVPERVAFFEVITAGEGQNRIPQARGIGGLVHERIGCG
jgi:hypothetical protein